MLRTLDFMRRGQWEITENGLMRCACEEEHSGSIMGASQSVDAEEERQVRDCCAHQVRDGEMMEAQ